MGVANMYVLDCQDDFEQWREQARIALQRSLLPGEVCWQAEAAPDLFGAQSAVLAPLPEPAPALLVPARAVDMLALAARFRAPGRWDFLYKVLWRLNAGERQAIMAGDPDGAILQKRIKAVRREMHHLHAFLRFRKSTVAELDWVAWHEPAHDILDLASSHFAERLGQQRWVIATPQDGVFYDGEALHYARPCPEPWRAVAKGVRDDESLWATYYRHIFNPARLNREAMQGHMPRRFWAQLEEGRLIPELISEAQRGSRRSGQRESVASLPGKQIPARLVRKP